MTRRIIISTCLALLFGATGAQATDHLLQKGKPGEKAGLKDVGVIVDEYIPVPPETEVDVVADVPEEAPASVWISGAWDFQDGNWEWVPGRWEVPPDPSATWISGYWKSVDEGWQWVDGHWALSRSGLGDLVTEELVIPAKLDETRPAKPSDSNHWVEGHWDWDGSWFWVPGHWTNKPHPKAEWVDGYWLENPGGLTWSWIGGHWTVK